MNEKGNSSSANRNSEYDRWASLASEGDQAYRQSKQGQAEFASAMTFEDEMDTIATEYADDPETRRKEEEKALKRALQRDAKARKQYVNNQAVRTADQYYAPKAKPEPQTQPVAEQVQPVPEPQPQPAQEPEAQSTPEPQPAPTPESQPQLVSEPEPEPAPAPEVTSAAESESANMADTTTTPRRATVRRASVKPGDAHRQRRAAEKQARINAPQRKAMTRAERDARILTAQVLNNNNPQNAVDNLVREQLEAQRRAELEAQKKAELEAQKRAELAAQAAAGQTATAQLDQARAMQQEIADALQAANANATATSQAAGQTAGQTASQVAGQTANQTAALTATDQLAQAQAMQQELAELMRSTTPTDIDPNNIVISANLTKDRNEYARDLAEKAVNAESSASKNVIKRLWGELTRKYREVKYTKEFIEGKRKTAEGQTLDEYITNSRQDAITRFMHGAMDELGVEETKFVHRGAGEDMKLNEATTDLMRGTIDTYIKEHQDAINSGADLEKMSLELSNTIGRTIAAERNQGKKTNDLIVADYSKVAMQALQAATHAQGLEQVMQGFKVYDAEVRDDARTAQSRNKVLTWLEDHHMFGAAQAVALGSGVVSFFTKSKARAAFGVGAGLGLSTVSAGLREYTRITNDHQRMLRDLENGEEYAGTAMTKDQLKEMDGFFGTKGNVKERLAAHYAKKQSKYEFKLGGTAYNMLPAKDLTSSLEQAMALPPDNPGRDQAIALAVADARVRIDISDTEAKGLIGYTSADRRGDERLKLDIALIRAEKYLKSTGYDQLDSAKDCLSRVKDEIEEDIAKKDGSFNRYRALKALGKAGKTLAAGAFIFLGTQELKALGDDNTIGLFERAENNNKDAEQTILANLRSKLIKDGNDTYEGELLQAAVEPDTKTVDARDRKAMQELRESGYQGRCIQEASDNTSTTTESVSLSESHSDIARRNIAWANNGTSAADGNETRVRILNGRMVSTMHGDSTLPDGTKLNYEDLVEKGQIRGYITVGDKVFETLPDRDPDTGLWGWGTNGYITTSNGAQIRIIDENGNPLYKFFEVSAVQNPEADGINEVLQTIPLATGAGSNSITDILEDVTRVGAPTPELWEFTKEGTDAVYDNVARGVSLNGFAFAPRAIRTTGLGNSRPRATGENATANTAAQTTIAPANTTPSAPTNTTPNNAAPAAGDQAPAAPQNPPAPAPENNPAPTNNPTPAPNNTTTPENPPAPANAPAPTAPENSPALATPENTPPQPASNPGNQAPLTPSDVQTNIDLRSREVSQMIENNRELLGDATSLFSDRPNETPAETRARVEGWLGNANTTDEQRQALVDIAETIRGWSNAIGAQLPIGRQLMNWYNNGGREYLVEPA